jgi:hypothetical protein
MIRRVSRVFCADSTRRCSRVGLLLRFGAESISRSLASGARRKKQPRDVRAPEVAKENS